MEQLWTTRQVHDLMKKHDILYDTPYVLSSREKKDFAYRICGLLTDLGFSDEQMVTITSFGSVGLVAKAVLLAAKTHHYVKTNYPELTELQIAHRAIRFYEEIYLTSQTVGARYDSKTHRKVLEKQYFEFPHTNPAMLLPMVSLTQRVYYVWFKIPMPPQE